MMLKIGLIVLLNVACLVAGNDKGNGFGDAYEWFDKLPEALEESESSGKPALVIIHQSWCPRCAELQPEVADSEEILALSDRFVMVNCMDDDEPKDPDYAPDGNYYPRIIFYSPVWGVLKSIQNKDAGDSYKYFYTEASQIVRSMKRALYLIKNLEASK